MSLWGLFVILGSVGVILSLGAAVLRPRDRVSPPNLLDSEQPYPQRVLPGEMSDGLQARVEALENEVDDLHRAVAALREENEQLHQRFETDS